jgi:hypothetical protein
VISTTRLSSVIGAIVTLDPGLRRGDAHLHVRFHRQIPDPG